MKTTQVKPIRHTKRLQALLDKYEVTLRKTDSDVTHAVKGTTVLVPPLHFAVYEAAIKANFLSWALFGAGPDHLRHYACIAAKDGFDLVDPNTFAPSGNYTEQEKAGRTAAEDYHYCAKLLGNAGLYYTLLD